MINICDECFTHFHDFVSSDYICPIHNCGGTIIEVDELISQTLIELWKKGYITEYSCSGHLYKDWFQCYIRFGEVLNTEELNVNIPDGFTYDISNAGILFKNIEYRVQWRQNVSFEEKFEILKRANINLFQWACSLPEYEL